MKIRVTGPLVPILFFTPEPGTLDSACRPQDSLDDGAAALPRTREGLHSADGRRRTSSSDKRAMADKTPPRAAINNTSAFSVA